MSIAELLNKRAALVQRAKAHEMVPQSPWSPDNAIMKQSLAEGHTLLSERPIAFIDDDEIVLVGPDAELVAAKLNEAWDLPADVPDQSPQARHAKTVTKKVELRDEGGIPYVRMSTQRWNGCLLALSAMGVMCIVTDGGR